MKYLLSEASSYISGETTFYDNNIRFYLMNFDFMLLYIYNNCHFRTLYVLNVDLPIW